MTFTWNDFFSSLQYLPSQPLVFQSVTFFLLFGVFYLLYSVFFNSRPIRNGLLLIFSLYFYYKISGYFVGVMVLMASIDYFIGKGIFKAKTPQNKKLLLVLSLVMNVGALLYFKYTNFLIESWTGLVHPGIEPVLLKIVQPLGISYFVFKSLTYIFDIHREMIEEPERNWFRYLLYVSFFPNIMAGPISKARDLLPQFISKPLIDRETLSKGMFLIMLGLIKKIVFADYLAANLVDRVFESPQYFTGLDALMASYGGLLQLYFDFAGYTDMMVGFGFLMGFTIEHNFNKPFLAGNITEFWRRWHITLYNWLNEYLYQPLAPRWKNNDSFGCFYHFFHIRAMAWRSTHFCNVGSFTWHRYCLGCCESECTFENKKMVPKGALLFHQYFYHLPFSCFHSSAAESTQPYQSKRILQFYVQRYRLFVV